MTKFQSLLLFSFTACTIQHYHPASPQPKPPSTNRSASHKVSPKVKPPTTGGTQNPKTGVSARPKTRPHTPPGKSPVKVVARKPPPPPSAEDVIFAPPPSITFSEHDLGTPYTEEFRAYRGTDGRSIFPKGKITTEQRTKYEGGVFTIDTEQELRAHAGAWGIQVSAGSLKGSRYAAQRALQIDRCSWIDDRTAMRNAPPEAMYYPAAVCFGHRYEAVLEGTVNQFTAGLKASFLVFSAGIESFAKQNRLKVDIKADGLKRKADCSSITFSAPAVFEACFEPTAAAPTPIWVEWRAIPGRRPAPKKLPWKPSRTSNCGGTQDNCRPCQSWRFESMEFSGEGSDFDGSSAEIRIEITEPNSAERKLYGANPSFKDRPIYASSGDVIRYYAYDDDPFFDDPLGTGFINVKDFHRDGRAVGGRLTAVGVCEKY